MQCKLEISAIYVFDLCCVFAVVTSMPRNVTRAEPGSPLIRCTWRVAFLVALLLSAESAWATTFSVNSGVDGVDGNPGDGICETLPGNGLCTVRAALEEGGTIQAGEDVTVDVPPGTYLLTLGTVVVPGDSPFLPTIVLSGSSASDTIIDGGGIAFNPSRASVTIKRVTVQNGLGIYFGTNALVEDSIIQNNAGPGITVGFTVVTIVRSTIRANVHPSPTGCGGGVFAVIGINVIDSLITGNTAATGGGLCTVDLAGGVFVTRSVVSDNRATAGDGGGIYVALEDASLLDSVVSGNSATGRGGGVRGLFVSATNSLVAENSALDGGGLAGFLALSNTTIGGNRAARHGGGVLSAGINSGGKIASSTITGNLADSDGDGIGAGGGVTSQSPDLIIRNSILAGNSDRGGEPADCAGPSDQTGDGFLVSEGYNLIGSSVCTITGDSTGNILGVDPELGPLRSNGGLTFTHALLAGSPAINAGNPAGCLNTDGAVLTVDQRGLPRPQFGRRDMGAFEFACADGQVDSGEQCDAGDNPAGDCCSPNCQLDAPGSPCTSDDEPCTLDACNDAGACTHEFPPLAGCREPAGRGASVNINQSATDRSDKVAWKWKGPSSLADFGNPAAGSSFTLCVADALGNLKLSATIPAAGVCAGKNCWRSTRSGYGYADPELSPDGLRSANLRASTSGTGSIKIKGKGENLAPGALPLVLPATVRLVRSDAPVCWESRLPTATRDEAAVFRARSE